MADGKKDIDEFTYVGERAPAPADPVKTKPTPPSCDYARLVALQILDGFHGVYQTTVHFRERMAERNFDVFDVIYAVRNGRFISGSYSEAHQNYEYCFRGVIDGTEFEAVIALSALHDFNKCPLLLLVTGCWKTKTSGRRNRY